MFRILRSMQFVLARFYQNVGEIVHERYEARRSFQVTRSVQPIRKSRLTDLYPSPAQLKMTTT
jgi:hypothetical protein